MTACTLPGDRHPTPACPSQGAVGGQQAHELADEQGVALGLLVNGGHFRLGGHHPREHLDEVLHVVGTQPPKVE
jgi:hypothetical protein